MRDWLLGLFAGVAAGLVFVVMVLAIGIEGCKLPPPGEFDQSRDRFVRKMGIDPGQVECAPARSVAALECDTLFNGRPAKFNCSVDRCWWAGLSQ